MSVIKADSQTEVVTLGGGCFWRTEAVFNSIEGVIKVEPGYSGGRQEDANYSGMLRHLWRIVKSRLWYILGVDLERIFKYYYS
jgi:hypothetical protein